MWERGNFLREIALTLEISIPMVSRRIKYLNLPKRMSFENRESTFWTEEEESRLKQLKKDGKSHAEIAKLLNKTINSVRNKCSKEIIKNPFVKQWTSEEEDSLKTAVAQNKTMYELMALFKRSFFSIWEKLKRLGLSANKNPFVAVNEIDLNHLVTLRLRGVKNGARKRLLEFNLSTEYIINLLYSQNFKCFYTGLLMDLTGRKRGFSLDRIDSTKGYIEGNIVLCLRYVNTMKMDMDVNEFINFCGIIYNNVKLHKDFLSNQRPFGLT